MMSSTCSIPIDSRTMSSGTPAASNSSGVNWLCVVVALWMASDFASPMLARWLKSSSPSTNFLPPSRPVLIPNEIRPP
jgi:hypothetical protein